MTVVRFPSKKDPKPEVDGAWPIMTGLLVLTIGAVFVWQRELGSFEEARAIYSFGLLPAHLFGIRQPAPQIDVVTPLLTLVTAQFLHGGWTHLMGNVLVLLLLGPLLERRIGSIRFLLIFLATGVAGLGLEAASSPSSAIPIIGASASIAGVIGGLARVDPGARIVLPSPRRGQWLRVIRVPALPIIVVWLIIQVYGIAFANSDEAKTIAFLAHGVGFVSGVVLAGWAKRGRART
jgi:membrane associated rhomboid family serine protease